MSDNDEIDRPGRESAPPVPPSRLSGPSIDTRIEGKQQSGSVNVAGDIVGRDVAGRDVIQVGGYDILSRLRQWIKRLTARLLGRPS